MHQILSNFLRWLATTHRGRRRFPCSGSGNILPGLHVSVNHVPSDAAGNNSEWTQNEEGNEPYIGRFAASRCIVLKSDVFPGQESKHSDHPDLENGTQQGSLAALISSSRYSYLPASHYQGEYLPAVHILLADIQLPRRHNVWTTMISTFWEIQQHDKNHVK